MTADIDIYRAAKLFIDQHGDLAALQAAMRTDALLALAATGLIATPALAALVPSLDDPLDI